MAFNPFLSMNEPAAPVGSGELNPFMMSDTEPGVFDNSDNPFAVGNPFSDFGGGGYDPPVGDTVPVDIFGGAEPTDIGAKQFVDFEADTTMDLFGSQPVKPTDLDLMTTTTDSFPSEDGLQQPTRPLPPETQNLILSVTGQMEFNSSHLLDRIPPTRTPSPVSVRDIHSPSPTPEPDMELEALEELKALEEVVPVAERAKPARPPAPPAAPARPPLPPPPARPAPPPIPQIPQRPPPPQAITDEINLFDAPAPVVIKPTKEAILSLYSAPKKEEKQMDFLSDDIMESMSTDPAAEPPVDSAALIDSKVTENAAESLFDNNVATSDAPDFSVSTGEEIFSPAVPNSPHQAVASMDCSEPATEMALTPVNNTSPFAESVADDFHTQPEPMEKNPFDSGGEFDTTAAFESPGTNIFGIDSANTAATADNIFKMDSDSFGTPTAALTSTTQANIFGTNSSPFDDSVAANAFASGGDGIDVFGVSQPATSSPFDDKQDDAFGAGTDGRGNVSGAGQASTSSPFDDINQADVFTSEGSNAGGDNIFGINLSTTPSNQGWGDAPEAMVQDVFPDSQDAFPESHDGFPESQDAFDAFSAKFDSTSANHMATSAWGEDGGSDGAFGGFEAEAFDTFLSMGAPPPPPAATPRLDHTGSRESTDDTFSVFIRPKDGDVNVAGSAVPVLAPPPRPQAMPESPRVNPFDKSGFEPPRIDTQTVGTDGDEPRRASGSETPPTPLFDEDVSQPLEEFPRVQYVGPGWEMHLRQPNKKKITGQRFWKKIFVRLAMAGDNPVVQLLNAAGDKEPFQELPLQACYSVSDVAAQQFDQFGKIFTVKLQYVFYKERPGVRPGQVTKAERITNKLSQFAAYAIQGDYQGVKEFGSDLRKLGLPVEHAPQVSQLFKIGSLCFEDVKQFSCCVEEALFRLSAHRDRALTYKMEEVQITAVDELYAEQDADGSVLKQIARVRVFFIGFLSGMPDVELGVNDMRRQGKEVVGRHDIIPVVTEEWIRVEAPEFHACVQPQDFDASQIIKFKPPDACYIELMRFRIRPPKNRELPLQLKAVWCVTGNKVELRADVLVPGFASRKLGQVPCEDVCIRFPIPECWIYLFRVEKHFRYGSVKSAHRRTGKIKGIERFLGAVDNLQESLIEVTSGQAKYEHQHRAIVWRMPRLPKEGQGAYTTHNLVCRMALTSYDQIPAELAPHAFVEFTMPATTASHVTVRSVSLQNHDRDEPPEKYVRYLARHEYIVGIERTSGQSAPAYAMAAKVEEAPPPPPAAPAAPIQPPSSDSDSD